MPEERLGKVGGECMRMSNEAGKQRLGNLCQLRPCEKRLRNLCSIYARGGPGKRGWGFYEAL